MANRSKSSGRWLNEHFRDQYVQQAQRDGWRSRAVYKLQQIDQKDHIFKRGATVVDLGAAPGGWSQYAMGRVTESGRVLATDVLPMDSLPDVEFVQGDFREPGPLAELERLLGGQTVDLVLSDMAPNMSGVGSVDQPAAMYLAELALEFSLEHGRKGSGLLVKVFQGEGFDAYLKRLRANYQQVVTRKPDASRARSREQYLLARGRR